MKYDTTNNQQPSLNRNILEGSETISKESREVITPEAVPTLTDNAEGNDIVQNLRSLRKRKSIDQYLEKIRIKYGSKFTFDFSNWTGFTGNKIKVICPKHGEFEQIPRNLLLQACKTGCKLCGLESKNASKTKSFQDFVEKANIIHNNNYEYVANGFRNRKSKVIIVCKEHGQFVKTAQKHLLGQGCWECKVRKLVMDEVLTGGYCEQLFAENPELRGLKACLYYLSINDGRLYKIGISRSLDKRLKGLKCKAKGFIKNIKVLWKIEDSLYNCFQKEQEILRTYLDKRVYFKWSTELFKENILPTIIN